MAKIRTTGKTVGAAGSSSAQKLSNNKTAPIIDPKEALRDFLNKFKGTSHFQISILDITFTYFTNIYAYTHDIDSYDFGTLSISSTRGKIKNECCKVNYIPNHSFDVLTSQELDAIADSYEALCKDIHTKGFFDYAFAYAANKSSVNCMLFSYGSKRFSVYSRNSGKNNATLIPVHRLFMQNKDVFSSKSIDEVVEAFVQNKIIPKALPDNVKKALSQMYETQTASSKVFEPASSVTADKITVSEKPIHYSSDIEKELLECDYKRFGFIKYEKSRLYDPLLGHWDLWNTNADDSKMIPRNPKNDVHMEYTAAIDFGTSSTVVVIQGETEQKIPLRIGTSDFFSSVDEKQFENPTYMQFVDFKRFKEQFDAKIGRPDTRFNDLPVSYNAKNSMIENLGTSDSFYTFFSEIKQWADGKVKKPILFDTNGLSVDIKNFSDTEDDDINPLVYYAYYIGLNINNMSRGICLDYLLSYPVTYESDVCEKIRKAFEIGIKKSLPVSVLEDEDLMRLFRVSLTASEPASYACCALQAYSIEPDEKKKILYGVFDFGGGTSDYDYGIYEDDEFTDRYDYKLTRFQCVGDRYLGGENILESLAYDVYLSNFTEFSKKKIPFKKPEFEKNVLLNEVLISENASVSAKVNSFVLKEKIRPIWEGTYKASDDKSMKYEINDASFYDIDGNIVNTIRITIDINKYIELIREKIRVGVEHFFVGLENAIKHLPSGYSINDFEKIHVFLAGNSSRSPIVREEFDRCINELGHKKNITNASDFYYILPPLGTKESDNIIYGDSIPEEYDHRPNCKTGVAFGLLEFRHGGNIRFVDEQVDDSDTHIKFKYYVGRRKKKELVPILNPNNAYDEWYPLISAELTDVEIYYTDKVLLDGSIISIADTKHYPIRLTQTDPQKKIYIRAVSSDSIEYAVASENEIDTITSGTIIKLK